MKTLYLIGGTMGVGKTAVSKRLRDELPNAVFLDGDWCWDASPFQVTAETRAMVLDNICYLLNSFVRCTAYDNIVFCWVMHEQRIIDTILARVDTADCAVKVISLLADAETLTDRLAGDIEKGMRSPDVLARSIARIPLYAKLNSIKIDTDGKSAQRIAEEIAKL